jgi:hypothetical protein
MRHLIREREIGCGICDRDSDEIGTRSKFRTTVVPEMQQPYIRSNAGNGCIRHSWLCDDYHFRSFVKVRI